MADDMEPHLYPSWKEGVSRFRAARFKAGEAIERSWFYDAFNLPEPKPNTPAIDAERIKLQFLSAFEMLRAHLLIEDQIALATVRGYGYRVVPPSEQTRWAEKEGIEEVKTAARKMGLRLSNVDLTALSDESRKENADALTRLSMLRGMVRQIAKD